METAPVRVEFKPDEYAEFPLWVNYEHVGSDWEEVVAVLPLSRKLWSKLNLWGTAWSEAYRSADWAVVKRLEAEARELVNDLRSEFPDAMVIWGGE